MAIRPILFKPGQMEALIDMNIKYPAQDLVDQDSGTILWNVVKRRAEARARHEWGGLHPPYRYLRDSLWVMREHAFREHALVCHRLGLPAPERSTGPLVSVTDPMSSVGTRD